MPPVLTEAARRDSSRADELTRIFRWPSEMGPIGQLLLQK